MNSPGTMVPPNRQDIKVVSTKLVPWTVTIVPPSNGPREGEMSLRDIGFRKWNVWSDTTVIDPSTTMVRPTLPKIGKEGEIQNNSVLDRHSASTTTFSEDPNMI